MESKYMRERCDENAAEALALLLQHASHDTGGSRRCAGFLLSLWDGDYYKADLQDLLYIDSELHAAMLIVFQYIYNSNNQLYTYVTREQMEPIANAWGHVFYYPNHTHKSPT